MASQFLSSYDLDKILEKERPLGKSIKESGLFIVGVVQGPFTQVSISKQNGTLYTGYGFARCSQADEPKIETGVRIAFHRAMKDWVEHAGSRQKAKEILNESRN